jgi:hypothetical protein
VTSTGTRTVAHARHTATGSLGATFARAGLIARGVIYLLIGWVALMLAIGRSNNEADQSGALRTLAHKHYGSTALWLLAIGFAAYSLWRISEAFFGVTGEGGGAGPRLKSAFRGVVYAFFAVMTISILHGSGNSQAKTQQDVTARVMRHSGGQWAVGIVGGVVVLIGLMLVAEGLRRKFLKTLRLDQMSTRTRSIVTALGVIGTTARGIVFAVAGALVIEAAKTFNPAKARGLDEALRTMQSRAYGTVILGAAAIGLLIFGLYGLCEARWRKV